MAGYTPVFDAIFTGSLHGKWPDLGLWLCLLAMADKHGTVDCTPGYIASVTGVPVDTVGDCLQRFMLPDPASRSPVMEGRRLVLIDEARPASGWRIVNHRMYRERARKQAHDERRQETGENVERMKSRRKTRRDPTRPDATRDDPLSNTNTNTNTNPKTPTSGSGRLPRGRGATKAEFQDPEWLDFKLAYPERSGAQPWTRALRALSARLAEGFTWTQVIEGARRYEAYCRATGRLGTQYVMHAATFVGPEKYFLATWEAPAAPMNGGRQLSWTPEADDVPE